MESSFFKSNTKRSFGIENGVKYKNFWKLIFINKNGIGIGVLMRIIIKAKARCQKGKGTISSYMVNNDNISSKVKE